MATPPDKEFVELLGLLRRIQVALHTRPGIRFFEFSSMVSVPLEDISDHRTYASETPMPEDQRMLASITSIKSSNERSSDPFAQVKYRGHWFSIDDRDFLSKRVFTFLMMLLTLSETGQKIQQPLLTIRAN